MATQGNDVARNLTRICAGNDVYKIKICRIRIYKQLKMTQNVCSYIIKGLLHILVDIASSHPLTSKLTTIYTII